MAIPVRILPRVAALLLALAGALPAFAQGLSEAQVKAGMLFNFAKFVEWPESAFAAKDAPFVLCLAGRENIGAALTALEGRAVQGRELRLRRGVTVDEIGACHMLFLPDSEDRRLALFVRAAGNAPVLLVSDIDGFTEAGGAITLVTVDSRVQFDVNLGAATRGGIRPPSQLLRLARTVTGTPRK